MADPKSLIRFQTKTTTAILLMWHRPVKYKDESQHPSKVCLTSPQVILAFQQAHIEARNRQEGHRAGGLTGHTQPWARARKPRPKNHKHKKRERESGFVNTCPGSPTKPGVWAESSSSTYWRKLVSSLGQQHTLNLNLEFTSCFCSCGTYPLKSTGQSATKQSQTILQLQNL